MARRNVRRIQWIPNDAARQAALRSRRTKLVQTKAEELSALCDASVAVVTHVPGEAEQTVCPAAPEATAILQRYAAADPSSVNTLDLKEFLGRRIAKLEGQLRRQEAANAEAEARLVLYDVVRGHKNVADVPLELLANFMKLVEKRIQQVAATIYLRSLSALCDHLCCRPWRLLLLLLASVL